jgi:hypothetical protein
VVEVVEVGEQERRAAGVDLVTGRLPGGLGVVDQRVGEASSRTT